MNMPTMNRNRLTTSRKVIGSLMTCEIHAPIAAGTPARVIRKLKSPRCGDHEHDDRGCNDRATQHGKQIRKRNRPIDHNTDNEGIDHCHHRGFPSA